MTISKTVLKGIPWWMLPTQHNKCVEADNHE